MTDFMAARTQMAISLGFHIIFAAIGMAMPFFMALSHFRWLRDGDPVFKDITKVWSKGVAIFFAVGAVSGTVLSFELGLLWPKFMLHAGPIIGMPFSWEGAAFFLEAIALGIFLYGWERVPAWIHWASGMVVGISGVLSGLFVICANGWMNSPAGFDWVNGEARNIDPWTAMFNRAALGEGIHMVIAAFAATGFAVAGLHALALLKKPGHRFHTEACKIGILIGTVASIMQPASGYLLAKQVAVLQPAKLAAMEALFKTSKPAALVIGGLPNEANQTVDWGLHIPNLLSFLAHGNFQAEVLGLDSIPHENWPPVTPVHLSFQLMVACGVFLILAGGLGLYFFYHRKTAPEAVPRRFLKLLVFASPLGFIAIEAGWVVTEVGRQPWIIQNIMRTSEAVTPMPGLIYPMLLFSLIYAFLAFVVTWLMMRQFKNVD